ncbi:MAG: DUF362 domain-containing protein [Bacteroidota bacterium]
MIYVLFCSISHAYYSRIINHPFSIDFAGNIFTIFTRNIITNSIIMVKQNLLFIFFIIIFINLFTQNTSKVYFTKDISPEGVMKVYNMIKDDMHGKVGIKVHFGEEGNDNYLKPDLMKKLVKKTKATFVETNVLYVSKRRYTESHIQLAKEHGFTYAPIDIMDSDTDKVYKVDMKHYKEVKVGSHVDNYDSFIIFSHFKGHGLSGFGGAIKNVSMGFASVAGKMALHASTIPVTHPNKCRNCNACIKECPVGAITLNPLKIDSTKCIGCGKCIGECGFRAFDVPWKSTEQSEFLERLVEYAKVISDSTYMVYINVLANISTGCDCARSQQVPFMEDIGIMASTDIVAIEKASHDLIDKTHNCDDTFRKVNSVSGKDQIEYAFKLGMGNKEYELIDLDK